MAGLIYTNQRPKLTKKQRAAREQLLKEQREIKRELKSMQACNKPLVARYPIPPGRDTGYIPSVSTGNIHATVKEQLTYTGDKMLGIGQLHKSNAVPVFKQEEAEEIARMRR